MNDLDFSEATLNQREIDEARMLRHDEIFQQRITTPLNITIGGYDESDYRRYDISIDGEPTIVVRKRPDGDGLISTNNTQGYKGEYARTLAKALILADALASGTPLEDLLHTDFTLVLRKL